MTNEDLVRELMKIGDVVFTAKRHFEHEAAMNAALHMAENVRPAPLATAIATASDSIQRLISELKTTPKGGNG